MTATICFFAWMYALLSEDNQSTGLTIMCWLAWVSAVAS